MGGIAIGKLTDGLVSRYINRRISTRITRFILSRNIHVEPNTITIIATLVGFASLPFYILGLTTIIPGILVQLSSILDGVDGELARALKRVSKFGSFIDSILDRLTDIAIISGIIFHVTFRFQLDTYLITWIILALSGTIMVSYFHARCEYDLGVHPAIIGRIYGFASRDVRLFIIFIGSIVGRLYETLMLIGILCYIYLLMEIIEIVKIYKRGRGDVGFEGKHINVYILRTL